MKRLTGINPALVTLYNSDNSIDFGAMEALVDLLIGAKVDGLYVCGTTGEFPLLTTDERRRVAEFVVKKTEGKVAIFVQVGHAISEEARRLATHAYDLGADGIGITTPYYYTYSENELFDYFSDILRAVPEDFPVYLYNIPQRTSNAITPSLLRRLLELFPNVVGLKDSSGSMATVAEFLLVGREKGVTVLQGADEQLLPGLCLGCEGSITGNGNAFPELFVRLWNEFTEGDLDAARNTQFTISKVALALGYGNIPLIKECLRLRGIGNGVCRKPLSPVGNSFGMTPRDLLLLAGIA